MRSTLPGFFNLFIIVVILFFGLCYFSTLQSGPNPPAIQNNKVGYALQSGDTSGVSRTFSKTTVVAGETFSVNIVVTINQAYVHHIYVIEENVPAGWQIMSSPDATKSGQTLKWAYADEDVKAVTKTYTYTVKAPATAGTTGTFSGLYGIDGMDNEAAISGSKTVTVGECTSGQTQSCVTPNQCNGIKTCNNGAWGACSPTQNYCDTDCDGTQECTSGTCAQCSCTSGQTQSCTTANGCQGTKTCTNGVYGTCSATQSFCDTNCDGTQECTSGTCPTCACTTGQTQSCSTSNGCNGIKTCTNGVYSTCSATQIFCDTNCDGTDECTSETCTPCACTTGQTQSCSTPNGCNGIKTCTNGIYSTCSATQSFCDTNCDGTDECTSETCTPCACTSGQTQSCSTPNGCQGTRTCTNGVYSTCSATQSYCDTNCDGTDECTSGTCPTCACYGNENQSCSTPNGCQGIRTCANGQFGTCKTIQNYCDADCDGTDECTDQECAACSCTGQSTQNCRTPDGCQGTRTCANGVYGSCEAQQNYCDTNCDGSKECTNEECPECGCIENWVCTSYGTCSGGLQTRTCSDENNCSTEDNMPATSKTCSSGSSGGGGGGGSSSKTTTITRCIESWVCTEWSGCSITNLRSRTCTDSNACGSARGKPSELETCRRTGTCNDGMMNNDEEGIDCGGSCPDACKIISPDQKPAFEIDAGIFDAEILDKQPYTVAVTNTGDGEAEDIEVALDKWTEGPKAIDLMLAGDKRDVQFDLYVPGDAIDTNLTIQVLYKGVPVTSKTVQASIHTPDHAVKMTEDTETGKLYPTLVFDNRNSDETRTITYEYSVVKDGETYLLDSSGDNIIDANTLYVKTDSMAIADLPDGEYEVKSVFYENGDNIGEHTTTITIGNNKKSFKAGYIFYVIIMIVIGFFGYTLYSNYNVVNER